MRCLWHILKPYETSVIFYLALSGEGLWINGYEGSIHIRMKTAFFLSKTLQGKQKLGIFNNFIESQELSIWIL